jgi:UDPglucose 6-dehydrogenase
VSQSNLKLGIIGAGFVGGSVINGFDKNVEQFVVDTAKNNNTIQDLVEFNPAITFICVPTPEAVGDSGDVDVSIVRQVLSDLYDQNYKGIVVIKSTITPKHLTKMKKDFSVKLVYNPEFLTEANAHQDFLNPHMQVLGGKWRDCELVEKAYVKHSSVKICPTFKTDLITASLLKYTINSYLATKVAFFNEMYELFETSQTHSTWDQFTDMLKCDPRIGNSHLKVPGPDGNFGFGGHCFPKDTQALLYYAKTQNSKLNILKEAVKDNAKKRKKTV